MIRGNRRFLTRIQVAEIQITTYVENVSVLKSLAYVDLQSKIETLTHNVDKKSLCLRVKKHGRPSQKLYK